jgi:hypothetical protein
VLGQPGDAAQRRRERVRVGVPVGGDAGLQRALTSWTARWPERGGSVRGCGSPAVASATWPPRRTARRASTPAAPSATSDFRRSAVPNAIDGETSTTSHVVSVRSGTCSLTCGTPVRALAAASSQRTSSPTW